MNDTYEISNEFWVAQFSQIGGGIISLSPRSRSGVSILRSRPAGAITSARALGSYNVVGYFGRLLDKIIRFEGDEYPLLHPKDFALHEFLPDLTPTSIDVADAAVSFQFPAKLWPAHYPFPTDIHVRYSLEGRAFAIEITAKNGSKRRPFSGCIHPFFRAQLGSPEYLQLQFSADGMFRWSGLVPIAMGEPSPIAPCFDFRHGRSVVEAPHDHTYSGWDGRATLTWPGDDLSVTIESDMRYFHIYRGLLDALEPVVALEPVIDPPGILDVVHQGKLDPSLITVLDPGESRTWRTKISLLP